jgi:hypothetical protein
MSKTSLNVPILQHVFHPSDFSPPSEVAFVHALKAALIAKATHRAPRVARRGTELDGVPWSTADTGAVGNVAEEQPSVCGA